jgi:hypothetical protein
LITRDIARMDHDVLESFAVRDLLAMCRKAAAIFMSAELPVGDVKQSFDDYVRDLSATTGMPHAYCRANAKKIHRAFDEMDRIVAGLTRGFDLAILDRGYGEDDGRMLAWFREARVFGAVLPSNSPGVHSLWAPAVALEDPDRAETRSRGAVDATADDSSVHRGRVSARSVRLLPDGSRWSVGTASRRRSGNAVRRYLDDARVGGRSSDRVAWAGLFQGHPR